MGGSRVGRTTDRRRAPAPIPRHHPRDSLLRAPICASHSTRPHEARSIRPTPLLAQGSDSACVASSAMVRLALALPTPPSPHVTFYRTRCPLRQSHRPSHLGSHPQCMVCPVSGVRAPGAAPDTLRNGRIGHCQSKTSVDERCAVMGARAVKLLVGRRSVESLVPNRGRTCARTALQCANTRGPCFLALRGCRRLNRPRVG